MFFGVHAHDVDGCAGLMVLWLVQDEILEEVLCSSANVG